MPQTANPRRILHWTSLRTFQCLLGIVLLACACHDQATPLHPRAGDTPVPLSRASDGTPIAALIGPIENVLSARTSLGHTDETLAATKREMILATVLMTLVIAAASALLLYRAVRLPAKRLASGPTLDALQRAAHRRTQRSPNADQKIVRETQELSRTPPHILHMAKMASLGKLAAAVAHELNNPLSAILMYARLVQRELQDSALPDDKREELDRYLGVVQKDASRCGDVLRNLLLFARPSTGDFTPHHLNQIIERSMAIVRHHFEMAHVQLEAHLLQGDDSIDCDADELQQAFVALLVNAVEAMPDGGRLTVRAAPMDTSVRVDISDSGTSIAEWMLPPVVEPSAATNDARRRLEIELMVVHGIVQRHGGTIEVESGAERGTTARIVLPRRPPESAAT